MKAKEKFNVLEVHAFALYAIDVQMLFDKGYKGWLAMVWTQMEL